MWIIYYLCIDTEFCAQFPESPSTRFKIVPKRRAGLVGFRADVSHQLPCHRNIWTKTLTISTYISDKQMFPLNGVNRTRCNSCEFHVAGCISCIILSGNIYEYLRFLCMNITFPLLCLCLFTVKTVWILLLLYYAILEGFSFFQIQVLPLAVYLHCLVFAESEVQWKRSDSKLHNCDAPLKSFLDGENIVCSWILTGSAFVVTSQHYAARQTTNGFQYARLAMQLPETESLRSGIVSSALTVFDEVSFLWLWVQYRGCTEDAV